MMDLLHSRFLYITIAVGLIGLAVVFAFLTVRNNEPEYITAMVTKGDVAHIVSVSGVVEAEHAAELAFPISGIVSNVAVREGDEVTGGATLATLEQSTLQAERQDALASLLIAQADRDELIKGPQEESRAVTNTTVAIAEENLARTISEYTQIVTNAKNTLLSTDLEAVPENNNNGDTPPIITGTYTCGEETEYRIALYGSDAFSGYSYKLSGPESGTYTAYTRTAAPLGSCGLYIQFDEDESYRKDTWTVTIPNSKSSLYVTNLNAYDLALEQQKIKVSAAEQALDLALNEETLANATPREEALRRANANVMQAQARLDVIDARINDRTITAPFDGTISSIDVLRGETVSTLPIITLVANDEFELTARLPEIDIARVATGQQAEVTLDAKDNEVLGANIVFIAPIALEIDGVAYFEATLAFNEPPEWLRGGLNADIEIITAKKEHVLKIPKRFLIEDNGRYSVLIPHQNGPAAVSVDVGFAGNDGYVEIIGLAEGDTIIAP